jgi:hypothetical protein
MRQQQEAQRDGEGGQQKHAPAGPRRQAASVGLNEWPPNQRHRDQHPGQHQQKEVARSETDRVVERQEGAK